MSTKKNEQNNSTASVQVNAPVNAPINIKVESEPKKTVLDVRKAAEEWFTKVEGICPPIRIGDPEGVGKRYDELRNSFVTRVDKEYDELPDKRVLYGILDNLKAQMK